MPKESTNNQSSQEKRRKTKADIGQHISFHSKHSKAAMIREEVAPPQLEKGTKERMSIELSTKITTEKIKRDREV